MNNFSCAFYGVLLLIGLTVFPSKSFSSGGDSSNNAPYIVVAETRVSNNSIELGLQLKNTSTRKLVFLPGLLSRDELVLYISRPTAFGGVIEELGLINDPDPEMVEVGGGKIYRAEIDLEEIFPSIRGELKKSELIIFWAVKVETADGLFVQRFGGYINVDKRQ